MNRLLSHTAVAVVSIVSVAAVVQAGDSNPQHYTVDAADTWQSIANAHGVTLLALQTANCDANGDGSLPASCTGNPRNGRSIEIPDAPPPPATTTTVAATTTTAGATTTTASPTTTTVAATTTTVPATTTTVPSGGGGGLFLDFTSPSQLGQLQFEVIGDLDVGLMHGDHNMACGAPTTLRDVHLPPPGVNPGEAVWWCAPAGPDTGHFMTGMDTGGYREVNFAPSRTFTNVRRVCWDQNETLIARSWTQMAVISEATYQANDRELAYGDPDLRVNNGPATMTNALRDGDFLAIRFPDVVRTITGGIGETSRGPGPPPFPVTDKATRYSTCVQDLENGNVRVTMVRPWGTVVDTSRGSFPDGVARVLFSDTRYHPAKDGSYSPNVLTWHWDNLQVEVA